MVLKKYLSEFFIFLESYIIFTVDYMRPMEVLPFIKQWLPDLRILEPDSLRKRMETQLTEFLEAGPTPTRHH